MARLWGLCLSGRVLSLWHSSCCCIGFPVKVERTRHLDWRNTSWRSFANNFALYHNKSYELGKTDPPAAFNHYKKVKCIITFSCKCNI
ncbi:hypothetical protein WN944_011579 [Citrus x changshan-huyou]|uniref:Secreted protein n=1 Tax=Citrus x changshan-huyou TaxID=2935761 RepID=A0AAP0QY22_9ROSI